MNVSAVCASVLTRSKAYRHPFPHSALCADAKKQHPWLVQADEFERQQSPEVKRQLEHWVDGIAAEVAAEEEHALRWVAASCAGVFGSCCSSATHAVPDMRGSASAVWLAVPRGQQGFSRVTDPIVGAA